MRLLLKQLPLAVLLGCLSLGLTGCQSLLSKIHIVEIQQGNILTPDMVGRLRTGMSMEEVRSLLGDPVLINAFDPRRWDYVYTLETLHHPRVETHLTVYFDSAGRVIRYTQ